LKKTLLIGARGQLGSDLAREFDNAVCWDIEEIDVCDLQRTTELVSALGPELVINTAAYHKVEDCETHPLKAFETNTVAVKNLANICQHLGATLVHFSTDYVFDGRKSTPYVESDQPSPLNFYGLSKYAGELILMNSCKKHYLFRVASLFGVAGARGKGGNFIETMIAKARAGEAIKVVDDIVMSPTSTRHLAHFISRFLQGEPAYGIYHATNLGQCSWFVFAKAIFEEIGAAPDLIPIEHSASDTSPRRPKFSALTSLHRFPADLEPMPTWRDALRDYLRQKGYIK